MSFSEVAPGAHASLAARHAAVLPRWVEPSYREPIALVSGEGRHVTDAEGRRYLDFFAGVLTNMVGYAIPEIVESVVGTVRAGMLHSSTAYLIGPQIELAERLVALSGIPDAKAYFTNSGTESVDAALLLATEYTGRHEVLAVENSYHGRSFATVAVTGNRSWRATSRSPFAVTFLPGYLRTQQDRHLDAFAFRELLEVSLRRRLDTASSGRPAALLAEPIQGVGGAVVPPEGWYRRLADLAREEGAVFIADETQTGWGRTGDTFWGHAHDNVTPDLMTFAKGLGNGLAVGGLVGRAEIVDALGAQSTSTFGGNHLAMANALAVLDYVLENDLQANAARTGGMIRQLLAEETERIPAVVDVRGRGLMIGIEFADPDTGAPAPRIAARVHEAARERGLLVGRGGLHRSTIRLGPPLSLTQDEAMEGTARLLDAIVSVDTNPPKENER